MRLLVTIYIISLHIANVTRNGFVPRQLDTRVGERHSYASGILIRKRGMQCGLTRLVVSNIIYVSIDALQRSVQYPRKYICRCGGQHYSTQMLGTKIYNFCHLCPPNSSLMIAGDDYSDFRTCFPLPLKTFRLCAIMCVKRTYEPDYR